MNEDYIAVPGHFDHMQLVLAGSDQRKLDRLAMDEFGLPPFTLMENAGCAAVAQIMACYGPLENRRVVIACGKGNNGGDGLVVARRLLTHGARVKVLMLGPPTSPEAELNYSLLKKLETNDPNGCLAVSVWDSNSESLPEADMYVDAVLGTGLTRKLRGSAAILVDQLNAAAGIKVSLDIPSGLCSDTGMPLGSAVQADLTVTMGALKPGLLLKDGPRIAGHVHLADIGIPEHLAFATAIGRRHWYTSDRGISEIFPSRPALAHKYSAGMVLVVGGSPGLTGAPIMAATAAARVGAGYVACAVPMSVQPLIASKLTEIATVGLPEHNVGGLDIKAGLDVLQPWLAKAGALLVGPGLGRHPDTQAFVRQLLASVDLPVVIDADGLRAVRAAQIAIHSRNRWILTPHWGEFRSMVSQDINQEDALSLAHEWSRKWNSTLVLKGLPSTVASPKHDGVICSTGSNALATAGTGDVLAGLCAGLAAQGCGPMAAATVAIHLGGAMADAYSARYPGLTMMAMDLIQELPEVLGELLRTRISN